jgi:hypothetical protein
MAYKALRCTRALGALRTTIPSLGRATSTYHKLPCCSPALLTRTFTSSVPAARMTSAKSALHVTNPEKGDPYIYQNGFGNSFASEAIPGVLPKGQNNPQKVKCKAIQLAPRITQRLILAAIRLAVL